MVDKNDQILLQLARGLMHSESVTSVDLSGNEFSARIIVEFFRAI